MITLKTKIGNDVLEYAVDGADFKSICKFSALAGMIPKSCGLCESTDIHLFHKSPGGNDYYGVMCKCGAEQTFHQRKEGGFYIKSDDQWTKYDGGNASQSTQQNTPVQNPDDQNIPF